MGLVDSIHTAQITITIVWSYCYALCYLFQKHPDINAECCIMSILFFHNSYSRLDVLQRSTCGLEGIESILVELIVALG